jgi:hypothetical protein
MKAFKIILSSCLFLLLILTCLQCNQPPTTPQIKNADPSFYLIGGKSVHKTLYISNKFSDLQILAIKQEAMVWQNKTNAIASFDFDKLEGNYLKATSNINDSLLINKVDAEDLTVQAVDLKAQKDYHNSNCLSLAFYDTAKGPIPYIGIVDERINSMDIFQKVFLHELGHALLLDHDPSTNAIMYKYVDKTTSDTVSKMDLAAFCKIYSCAIKED